MTRAAPAAWPGEAARLLEPSISYALGAVLAVTAGTPAATDAMPGMGPADAAQARQRIPGRPR